jgi:hypothetical protein
MLKETLTKIYNHFYNLFSENELMGSTFEQIGNTDNF